MSSPDTGAPLLEVQDLAKHFPLKAGLLGRPGASVKAVDGVSFALHAGETLGIVGESGCGKSTTARLLMHLILPSAGTVRFEGKVAGSRQLPMREFRRQVQMVFQDSYASLNPRLTIEDSIAFAPIVHGTGSAEAVKRARGLLDRVGLEPARFAGRYPHELSGGQRQRVNIARALALQPRVLILDEAVSALDKSVEAQVLNLLLDLKDEFGLSYIFISHDLEVVRFVASRVLVMYLGRVAEVGPTEALYTGSRHPYTTALLGSMLSMDPDDRTARGAAGRRSSQPDQSAVRAAASTRAARLPKAVCSAADPALAAIEAGHAAACHMAIPGSGHSKAAARAA